MCLAVTSERIKKMRLKTVTSVEKMRFKVVMLHLEDEFNYSDRVSFFEKRLLSQLPVASSQSILDVYSLLLSSDVTEELSL